MPVSLVWGKDKSWSLTEEILDTICAMLEHSLQKSFIHVAEEMGFKFQVHPVS
jgi:hypothetical protein